MVSSQTTSIPSGRRNSRRAEIIKSRLRVDLESGHDHRFPTITFSTMNVERGGLVGRTPTCIYIYRYIYV